MKWSKLTSDISRTIVKHQPKLLILVGTCGMIVTTGIAVHATPKAMKLLEQKKEELQEDNLSAKEVVKATWKTYVPAMATGIVSVACLLGGDTLYAKRGTALAAAYTLSETALREYKNKVIDTFGEESEKTIRDAIAKDRIVKNPIQQNEVFVVDGNNTLFYDSLSGRYFKSSVETVRKAENQFNRTILSQDYATLNDLYYELGLSNTVLGDTLGWNMSDGLFEIEFSAQLSPTSEPCVVIDFRTMPIYC